MSDKSKFVPSHSRFGGRLGRARGLFLVGLFLTITALWVGWTLLSSGDKLPPGIISGNGRMEAQQINIAARYPGRVLEIRVREGDVVQPGQILAVLDTRELAAALRAAEARIVRARQERDVSVAMIDEQRNELQLASIELDRAQALYARGFATTQLRDQRLTRRHHAAVALTAAGSRRNAADADINAAEAEADRIREQIAEARLVAPTMGRVLYRLAQPGELVAAGGPIATILDLSDVYMTIFLSTREAGALSIGAPARILLDGMPSSPLPGRVSFVSPEAQFTPRQVETQTERDNLMYRVRVRIPDAFVRREIDRIKTGVTGVAFVRLNPNVAWPAKLESDATRQFDAR